MEKVSIIIPFYNCPYVDQAIESALSQTYPNVEVIVVNDGSTKFNEKIKKYTDKIKYIEKENGGTASALNLGIKNATGDYFSWLSSDDIYDSEKISRQLKFMSEKKASALYSPVVFIDSSSKKISQSVGVYFSNKKSFLEYLLKGCFINGCSVLLKMDILFKAGLFDESLPYTHDYDLWIRVTQYCDFYYFNEPLVFYRIHEEMGSNKYKEIIYKEIKKVQNKHRVFLNRMIYKEWKKQRLQ